MARCTLETINPTKQQLSHTNSQTKHADPPKYSHTHYRYHSEVRQEAVQQALAAMNDKPKQLVPMSSKRASVAQPRPTSSTHEDDDLSTSEDEGEEEDDEGSLPNLVCETRNLALGLSDTSSTSSLASGHNRFDSCQVTFNESLAKFHPMNPSFVEGLPKV